MNQLELEMYDQKIRQVDVTRDALNNATNKFTMKWNSYRSEGRFYPKTERAADSKQIEIAQQAHVDALNDLIAFEKNTKD